MGFFFILESFLCICTLGTIVPTTFLGKKLKSNLPLYYILSGIIVGILFSLSNSLNQIGYKDLWGIYAWFSVSLSLMLLAYILFLSELSLKSALIVNFLFQILLVFSLPIHNELFIENTPISQIFNYIILTGSISFVFYNIYKLYFFTNKNTNLSMYLYIVLLILIAFKSFS